MSEHPTTAPERAEDAFFESLLAGDVARLDAVLADDFLIVDVIAGAVVDRPSFLGTLRDGLLAFERVELVDRFTRVHDGTAVIVGRTEMSGSFGGAGFAASSRYTHVLLRDGDGRWRLLNAQGTRVVDA